MVVGVVVWRGRQAWLSGVVVKRGRQAWLSGVVVRRGRDEMKLFSSIPPVIQGHPGPQAAYHVYEAQQQQRPPAVLQRGTNINKKKKSKNTKTIKKEWKQMKQGKGNTVK